MEFLSLFFHVDRSLDNLMPGKRQLDSVGKSSLFKQDLHMCIQPPKRQVLNDNHP